MEGWGKLCFSRCTGFPPQRTAPGYVFGKDEYWGLGTLRAGLLLLLYRTHVNILLGCRGLRLGAGPGDCWLCCHMPTSAFGHLMRGMEPGMWLPVPDCLHPLLCHRATACLFPQHKDSLGIAVHQLQGSQEVTLRFRSNLGCPP